MQDQHAADIFSMSIIGRHGSTLKLLILFCGVVQESSSECDQGEYSFAYRDGGPEEWKKLFPKCSEKRQSPIALDTTKAIVKRSPTLQWFNWHNVPDSVNLENNGHTVMLTASWNSSEDTPYVTLVCRTCSSGSNRRYIFAQLHFHWGSNDEEGSEHTLNKMRYPLEMHVVTYSSDYKDLPTAIASGKQNAVGVLTYFFRICDTLNCALQDLVVSHLSEILNCDDKTQVEPMKLHDLVPEFNRNFFIYNGTLTTPPCSKVAMFLISKEPQPIKSEQLPPFRSLTDNTGQLLTRNFRNIQKDEDRKVLLVL